MKLSKYLRKQEAGQDWRYVGTVWGSDEWDGTSEEFADFLQAVGYDGKFIDHPAYSRRTGYYMQAGDIWANGGVDEMVMERK